MSRTGFLLAEDEALKTRLSGITVSDDRNASRPVKVFFRYPEGETEKEYPFITIEMVSLVQALNRQHSEHYYYYQHTDAENISNFGNLSIGYFPSEIDQDGMDDLLEDNQQDYLRMIAPIPVDLTYQISTYTRSALHDRQLTAKLLRYILPFRSNALLIPADGTTRRLDMLGWQQADLLDNESGYRKRIFRKVYTLKINAEIPREDWTLVKRATSVVANITNVESETPVFNPPFSEAF
jgi:hypothetical protein